MQMPSIEDVLQQEIDRFMNIGLWYTYDKTAHPRAYFRQLAEDTAYEQISKANAVIDSITDSPLPTEHWKRVNDEKGTSRVVKADGRHFSFNFKDPSVRAVLYENLYDVVERFMNKLPISARWLVQYKFGERWFSVPITKDTLPEMLDQIREQALDFEVSDIARDSNELMVNSGVDPSDSVFICHVRQIGEIHFIDTTAYEALMKPPKQKAPRQKQSKAATKKQAPKGVLPNGMTKEEAQELANRLAALGIVGDAKAYKSREGAFFKYVCTLPIDLKKFQIFNRIDREAVDIIDSDNCVVWALKQAGIDEETVERVKSIIGTRHFPQTKFQSIADDTGLAFTIKYYRPTSDRTDVSRFVPKGQDVRATVQLVLFDDHYMLDDTVNVSTYAIKNLEAIQNHPKCSNWSWEQILTTNRFLNGKERYEKKPGVQTPIMSLLKVLFDCGHMREIHFGDFAGHTKTLHKQKLAPIKDLRYNEKWCCRLKQPYVKTEEKENTKNKKLFKLRKVVYADFECSTDGIHKPYNICAMSDDKTFTAWGDDCARTFLNWEEIVDGTQIYFHNLSYDINFIISLLTDVVGTPIIKSGRTMQLDGKYKGKCLRFKDSLAIISAPLKMFPTMFNLGDVQKEVFPYKYYNSKNVQEKFGDIEEACRYFKTKADKDEFKANIEKLQCGTADGKFDLEKYSSFYCMQDVKLLHDGFEQFRRDLLKVFDIDAYYFVSISSIANRVFEKEVYWKNNNLYDLSGTPREFISRAVLGGRVMMANNQKQENVGKELEDGSRTDISDFDAVSLYPSAIARLYTIEGKPKVIPGNNVYWLLDHLMDDDQSEPDLIKFISGFVIEIEITEVGKPRAFPLIVRNPSFQTDNSEGERSTNEPCTMYVDHITLIDLIKYQEIKFKFIRGYYWDGKRDFRIRDCIRNLFELRLKYKAEKNPIQEIIKLIMNSVYGKTILKPIDYKIVFKSTADSAKYVSKNYNTIESMEHLYGSNLVKFKKLKPINDHFNFCMFGVNILSMSKRIMNEVMCLAEDLNIHIYYQDTDSMHLQQRDLRTLQDEFQKKYGRELVGKSLGQFHSDFASINPAVSEMPVAIESVFCGKKTYIDMLKDVKGNIGFHARMKGIPMQTIEFKANELFPTSIQVKYDENLRLFIPQSIDAERTYSIMQLYRWLYCGQEVEFDLAANDRPCFDLKDNYSIESKTSFKRKLKF